MEKGLLEKTGHPLEHWIKLVEASKLEKHKEIMDFLKTEHGFTHGYANFVTLKSRKADAGSHDNEVLLKNQYQGKEILYPIYEKLLAEIAKFGVDIIQTPKKDSVSVIRKKQFALIKPATKIRIDLGIKLKGKPYTDRLGDSGPFGSMCTHRVQLTAVEDVDQELIMWLKEAYDAAV
ncbi:DUF5655 domain-containing protein [Ekhidna sp.]|uniref:DUF5655 domain-containing protein n=1 Tax=Ekhidna sp. TaxID=2608089 RepID=UPI003298E8FF